MALLCFLMYFYFAWKGTLKTLIFLIFYVSFKNNTSLRLCACIICSLFFTYALLEAAIEKCLLNRCLFKLAKSL